MPLSGDFLELTGGPIAGEHCTIIRQQCLLVLMLFIFSCCCYHQQLEVSPESQTGMI